MSTSQSGATHTSHQAQREVDVNMECRRWCCSAPGAEEVQISTPQRFVSVYFVSNTKK